MKRAVIFSIILLSALRAFSWPRAWEDEWAASSGAYRFSPSAWIGLNANIDMDSPGKFWDGGNVRAMLRF